MVEESGTNVSAPEPPPPPVPPPPPAPVHEAPLQTCGETQTGPGPQRQAPEEHALARPTGHATQVAPEVPQALTVGATQVFP